MKLRWMTAAIKGGAKLEDFLIAGGAKRGRKASKPRKMIAKRGRKAKTAPASQEASAA